MPVRRRLEDFRAEDLAPAKPIQPNWLGHTGFILGVDQTIANTGWCLLGYDEMTRAPYVGATGMVKTEPEVGRPAMEDTMARALGIHHSYCSLIAEYDIIQVVHEMPIIHARRTESSLMAATSLRIACAYMNVPVTMVSATRTKKLITGKQNASKQEVKAAVKSWLPDVVNFKPNNEHTNDAAALALVYARTNW